MRQFRKKIYNNYIEVTEQRLHKNPKYFWSFIRSKKDEINSYPNIMTNGVTYESDGSVICNLFANSFSKSYVTTDPGNKI